ncbi:restriction endonuclease subunit S [Nocardia farcinica]|uniref:restriction endonuclease subunit S n=1 Tax=Nocardia farcinica TaxID=37329 RepID=UPI002457080E|nr:restriction endonuclease subunit S [Nocardia farcinica]
MSEDGRRWFGELPARWAAAPIVYHFEVVLGKMINARNEVSDAVSAPYLAAGSIQPEHLVLDETKRMNFSKAELRKYALKRDDIVVVEGGAGYGRSHLLKNDLVGWGFQNHVARVRQRSGSIMPGFLLYCLKACLASGHIEANNRTATLPSLSREVLGAIIAPVPPPDEQRAIVYYLDHETAQIDALVAKQDEFIGLLRERRSRVREVLADRVNAGARLRWALREVDQRVGSGSAELPLLSVSIDWGVRRRDDTTDKLARAEDLSHYKVCFKGDIVVNRMRAFQGALGVAPIEGIVSPDYAVLRAASDVHPHWLAEVMRTKAFVGEIVLRLRGIGGTDSGNVRTPRINTADLLDIRADIPGLDTQYGELMNLTTETTRIDALIAKAEEHIALAKERRSALITAAVTGQIDVRTARMAG